MDDLHDETSDLAAHVADELASADDFDEETPCPHGVPLSEPCATCIDILTFYRVIKTPDVTAKPADGGGQLAPLTEARLAADILRRWFLSNEPVDADRLQEAVRAAINALAERERLLAVARAMAKGPVSYDGFGCYTCSHCEQEYMECDDPDDDRPGHIEHTVDCPVTQARAALAAADAPGERE